jgi:FixJ family two-component response regulator
MVRTNARVAQDITRSLPKKALDRSAFSGMMEPRRFGESPRPAAHLMELRAENDGAIIERVHIIDDDPSVRSALANLVAAVGREARTYGSVDAFLTDHQHALAGCFLLDVRLPGLSGLEFLNQMAALGLHLPVILISGHGDVPMTVRGMKAGAVDFLTKPFQPSEVLDAVSRALDLDRERRRDEVSRSDITSRYKSLTRRERQVMALVTAGKMNKQAAGDLALSEITVKVYRAGVMRKMRVRTLADLVKVSEQLTARAPELFDLEGA